MKSLRWGMIGGGEGSQIGPAHRLSSSLDGLFEFSAGALDARPGPAREFGISLGLDPERAYGSWREMLEGESGREDRIHLVTVATPNSTHFEIVEAFLRSGFGVFCEKPMTLSVEEGESLARLASESEAVFAVNYGYTGYPMVRQMRSMVLGGELGAVRLVKAEFSHGHHADASAEAQANDRIRWRYDPAQVGVSAQFADCGIHALHMASFATGQEIERLSADFASCVPSRALEDDAMINFRMTGGAVGRLWTSAIAVGRQHGLGIELFGEKGGLRWEQESPNRLFWTPLGESTRILERGAPGLSAESLRGGRFPVGHVEGILIAFANLYRDLHEAIRAKIEERPIDPLADLYPKAEDGLRSVSAIHAAAESAKSGGEWIDARPPMLR